MEWIEVKCKCEMCEMVMSGKVEDGVTSFEIKRACGLEKMKLKAEITTPGNRAAQHDLPNYISGWYCKTCRLLIQCTYDRWIIGLADFVRSRQLLQNTFYKGVKNG